MKALRVLLGLLICGLLLVFVVKAWPPMGMDEIVEQARPLVKPAVYLKLRRGKDAASTDPLRSHFGGAPYLEAQDEWPRCEECDKDMVFIFQLNLGDHPSEAFDDLKCKGFDFLTFFCCYPCESSPPHWEMKTYRSAAVESLAPREVFQDKKTIPFCSVVFGSAKSLPDWEGIDVWGPEVQELSVKMDADEPWAGYDKAVALLVGESQPHCHVGGYPVWVQGEDTPRCRKCNALMRFLFEIGSDDEADLNWVDKGAIYLFSCPEHFEEKELVEQFF